MYSGSSSLNTATSARETARTVLTRTEAAEKASADQLDTERQTTASQVSLAHQILDRTQTSIGLANQVATLGREAIAAVLNEDPDQYNAARDQLNAIVDQYNPLVDEINTLMAQLNGSTSSPAQTSGV